MFLLGNMKVIVEEKLHTKKSDIFLNTDIHLERFYNGWNHKYIWYKKRNSVQCVSWGVIVNMTGPSECLMVLKHSIMLCSVGDCVWQFLIRRAYCQCISEFSKLMGYDRMVFVFKMSDLIKVCKSSLLFLWSFTGT